MIGYIEGKILKKEDERVLVLANQVGYEILLPAFVMENIAAKKVGEEVALYVFYQQTERQPKPVLIGSLLFSPFVDWVFNPGGDNLRCFDF